MIAKGTTHNNGARLAAYMTTGKEGERAELWQLRGFASDNIKDAFRSVHGIAEATQCEKPFFHVQVRNPEGEELTRAQWEEVADRIEAKLGYSDQPRAIAFHVKDGHEHMHVAWSRIDDETLTAMPLPFFKLRLKEVCRELEGKMELTPVPNERPGPSLAPSRDEEEQARRLGVDLRDTRATIRDCRDQADCGRAFVAALEDRGLTLCQGDRRDYVVLDPEGGIHAMGKRILGIGAGELRSFMADVDRESLPTVEQAREGLAQEHATDTASHDIAAPAIGQPGEGAPSSPGDAGAALHTLEHAASRLPENLVAPVGKLAAIAFDIVGKVTEKAVDMAATGLESLLGGGPAHPPSAEQQRAEVAGRAAQAVQREARKVDWALYLKDEAYRQQVAREEIVQRQDRERQEADQKPFGRDR